MRHAYAQMSPARRQQILDDCESAGRNGSQFLPSSVHVHGDELSDTLLLAALDAHEAGLAERQKEKQP